MNKSSPLKTKTLKMRKTKTMETIKITINKGLKTMINLSPITTRTENHDYLSPNNNEDTQMTHNDTHANTKYKRGCLKRESHSQSRIYARTVGLSRFILQEIEKNKENTKLPKHMSNIVEDFEFAYTLDMIAHKREKLNIAHILAWLVRLQKDFSSWKLCSAPSKNMLRWKAGQNKRSFLWRIHHAYVHRAATRGIVDTVLGECRKHGYLAFSITVSPVNLPFSKESELSQGVRELFHALANQHRFRESIYRTSGIHEPYNDKMYVNVHGHIFIIVKNTPDAQYRLEACVRAAMKRSDNKFIQVADLYVKQVDITRDALVSELVYSWIDLKLASLQAMLAHPALITHHLNKQEEKAVAMNKRLSDLYKANDEEYVLQRDFEENAAFREAAGDSLEEVSERLTDWFEGTYEELIAMVKEDRRRDRNRAKRKKQQQKKQQKKQKKQAVTPAPT